MTSPLKRTHAHIGLAFALSIFAISDASAERISIASTTPNSPQQLVRREGSPASVTAKLTLPAGAKTPVPAVILKHGSGGMDGATGANIRKWARTLNGWGFATLTVDSFGPRKILRTSNDQSQLSSWADVADTLAALKLLGADPRIDRKRIGIMGWSRGGSVAMTTMFETVRKSAMPDDLKFAAHIVVYGSASTQYRGETNKSPVLFLHGEADDYVPIAPVREFAGWAQSAGHAVSFVSYPGAYHHFDVERTIQGVSKSAQTVAKCDVVIDLTNARVLRVDHKSDNPPQTGINAYMKSCGGTGAHLVSNAKARADAVLKVQDFLKRTLQNAD